MEDFPWDTICQVCSGVPPAQVAATIWEVGHTQLTSPTSEEPDKGFSEGR